jgi:hypothetical protein
MQKRRVPQKALIKTDSRMVEKIIPIKDKNGRILFEGTEYEWRQRARNSYRGFERNDLPQRQVCV